MSRGKQKGKKVTEMTGLQKYLIRKFQYFSEAYLLRPLIQMKKVIRSWQMSLH